jgi:hypothetical protein
MKTSEKLYTKEQIIKKYKGKYIKVYPYFTELWDDKKNCWITTYRIQGVSNFLKENFNLPEDAVIKE